MNREAVHCFQYKDFYFAVDGNSGSVHQLDELAFAVISRCQEGVPLRTAALADAGIDASPEELAVVVAEVEALVKEGLLFSEPLTLEIPPKEQVVKALCLNVSHDCNIRCRYCFAGEGSFGGERSLMPLETAKRSIDFLIEHSRGRRQIEVDFFGGEPLLNFPVVQETVEYGRRRAAESGKDIRFTITTNGVGLTPKIADYLNENMYNVVLSLDGRREVNDRVRQTINGKGSVYDTIVPKFRELVAKRPTGKVHYIRGTFTRYNLDFATDAAHYLELGFRSFSLEPVVLAPEVEYALQEEDLPRISQEYERLADLYLEQYQAGHPFQFFHFNVELKKGPCIYKRISGCGAGDEYLAVAPDGNLYPCHQFVGEDHYQLGSVFSGLSDQSIRQTFQESHVLNKPKCTQCWAKYYCSGGCHANNLSFMGDLNEPYPLSCAMEKKRLECSFYLQAACNQI